MSEKHEEAVERRQILKAASAFAAALAALGISPDDWSAVQRADAQTPTRRVATRRTAENPRLAARALKRALATKDIKVAITETRGLTDKQKTALNKLTREDLEKLAAIQQKVADIAGPSVADTGYVFW